MLVGGKEKYPYTIMVRTFIASPPFPLGSAFAWNGKDPLWLDATWPTDVWAGGTVTTAPSAEDLVHWVSWQGWCAHSACSSQEVRTEVCKMAWEELPEGSAYIPSMCIWWLPINWTLKEGLGKDLNSSVGFFFCLHRIYIFRCAHHIAVYKVGLSILSKVFYFISFKWWQG